MNDKVPFPKEAQLIADGGDVELIRQLENARYQQLVLRDINVPEVRWRFKQGDIDLRTPVHQYLYRQSWSNGVYVGKLMQRLTTMKILPDSIPTLTPKIDFRLRFNDKKFPSRVRKRESCWRDSEAGELLSSKVLRYPPRMEIIPHYKEWWLNKKYTVVMLDLGAIRDE
jgi:large subunit ribosomal protein L35